MAVDEKIKKTSSLGGGENYRWGELMQNLHNLSKLQEDASHAQIDARQKRRQASFKRQEVWLRDAEFMRHVQELSAQGHFNEFKNLAQLAKKCQTARDVLGPVEQEGIEAEQRWEGQLWELQRAEERVFHGYQDEFGEAAQYSQDSQSTVSTEDHHSTVTEFPEEQGVEIAHPNTIPQADEKSTARSTTVLTHHQRTPLYADAPHSSNSEPKNVILSDLVESAEKESTLPRTEPLLEWDSDSGIADINRTPITNTNDDLAHSFQKIPKKHFTSLELYPHLLNDFGSTRDRVNKWLENTTLVSRFEGISLYTILKDQLGKENALLPTNWAQLVVAYWDMDGASIPQVRPQREGGDAIESDRQNEENAMSNGRGKLKNEE
jgi:hypothetical protein